MGAPYRVYTNPGNVVNACNYYRLTLPLQTMEKLGLPVMPLIDNDDRRVSERDRAALFLESDFTMLYQCTGQMPITYMEMAQKFKPMKDDTGAVRYPPTFILDSDDDVFNVMPLNVTYGSLGTRRWDGEPLKDGDRVGVAHPNEIPPAPIQAKLNTMHPSPLPGAKLELDGHEYVYDSDGKWHNYVLLWQDGGNMNIAQNKERIDNWRKSLKMAHLITVSTPRVGEAIKRECGEDLPIFVSPNAIDFDEYPTLELAEHPGEVRILWEGSATHHEGLWPLNATLAKVAEKYPETTWWFFGAPYKWARKNLPPERVKMIPWVDYQAYKLRLATLCADINLAPLAQNLFNNSRSAIRWYEASSISRPAATIAQRWAAYRDEIEDGKTGLLFDTPEELETKLSGLIEDAKLRQTLAANAKDWVRTNRDAKKIALRLFHKWSEVREEQKLGQPYVEDQVEEELHADPV